MHQDVELHSAKAKVGLLLTLEEEGGKGRMKIPDETTLTPE